MNKTSKKIIIGSSILVGSVALFFIGRGFVKRLKNKSNNNIQGGSNGGSSNSSSSSSSYDPSDDMKSLEGYIIGYNLFYYPDEVQAIFNALDDSKLRILANAWKKKHKETLWASLDDEHDGCGWFSNCYEAPMKRLKSLGL